MDFQNYEQVVQAINDLVTTRNPQDKVTAGELGELMQGILDYSESKYGGGGGSGQRFGYSGEDQEADSQRFFDLNKNTMYFDKAKNFFIYGYDENRITPEEDTNIEFVRDGHLLNNKIPAGGYLTFYKPGFVPIEFASLNSPAFYVKMSSSTAPGGTFYAQCNRVDYGGNTYYVSISGQGTQYPDCEPIEYGYMARVSPTIALEVPNGQLTTQAVLFQDTNGYIKKGILPGGGGGNVGLLDVLNYNSEGQLIDNADQPEQVISMGVKNNGGGKNTILTIMRNMASLINSDSETGKTSSIQMGGGLVTIGATGNSDIQINLTEDYINFSATGSNTFAMTPEGTEFNGFPVRYAGGYGDLMTDDSFLPDIAKVKELVALGTGFQTLEALINNVGNAGQAHTPYRFRVSSEVGIDFLFGPQNGATQSLNLENEGFKYNGNLVFSGEVGREQLEVDGIETDFSIAHNLGVIPKSINAFFQEPGVPSHTIYAEANALFILFDTAPSTTTTLNFQLFI